MTKTFKTPNGTELPFLNLRGKDYLQVAHRLVWFREEHPEWSIETNVTMYDKATLGFARISNEQGRTIATAHKYEDVQGFQDHLEKAETGAIGRALALCGYGTQFAPELDEGERIVDSPIQGTTKATSKETRPTERAGAIPPVASLGRGSTAIIGGPLPVGGLATSANIPGGVSRTTAKPGPIASGVSSASESDVPTEWPSTTQQVKEFIEANGLTADHVKTELAIFGVQRVADLLPIDFAKLMVNLREVAGGDKR